MPAGRPSYTPTPEIIAQVEKLASQGLTLEQIAYVLGICTDTLCVKKNEYPELSEAIKRGKAKGIAQITNKLHEKALEGDNTAMIFYLKNRDPENWQDVQKREHYGKDGGPIEAKATVITATMDAETAARLYQEALNGLSKP
jgi:hypothetical protein